MYIVFLLPIIKGLYFWFLMFQQEHYNIKCLFKYFKKYYLCLPFVVSCYLAILFIFKNSYLDLFVYVFVFIFSLIKLKYVLRLKFTKRILRLLVVCSLLCVVPFLFSFSRITFLFVLYCLPLFVVLASLVVMPFELLIKNYYKNKAIKKLKKIDPYVICITGSFGKTTVKKMLESIYKDKYLVCATPKSYNTPMGISKCILNDMSGLCELFICEAGATKCGDILEITKMVNPDFGIITSVGYQHMSSFKSIDNVLKTKWELAKGLRNDGKLLLNYKNEYLNGLSTKDIGMCVGVNSYYGKYYACNIVYDDLWTEFDIYSFGKFVIHIKTKLLGDHNIDNIVMCYAVKRMLDDRFYVSDDNFKKSVLKFCNVENRLSLRCEEYSGVSFRYLDDSFNSNVNGFLSATKVIKRFNGVKCIITPGIVDGGIYSKYIADMIVSSLDGFDDVVFVNNKELKQLKSLLVKKNIKFKCVSSFLEGLNYLKKKYLGYKGEYINILIENDLPDNYLMR